MGITGLGKPLIGSQFVNGMTDEDFLNFLHVGRDVSDPLNTTGVTMPAKGGNPNLTDDDLLNVIAYVRSLNAPAGHTNCRRAHNRFWPDADPLRLCTTSAYLLR